MAGLPLLLFLIFPAVVALLVRFVSKLINKPVAFFPVFLTASFISICASLIYIAIAIFRNF
ncbi:hypothetical protein [Budvicia aquatica]|uniref:Uncharacterized protein n=1 Tax=Budvicia aquatica TaxID=82979 RepID=A0A2C6DNC0_9GAMM|nr:hypothetical protein [Budvicia aquatica]PHI30193.1 hypothetical protein CRN84_13015 [Budvicia aquatica]GKX53290.1 hypothetical protein SOASR029_35990 [Budvicia aquatica]VFS49236.1 Uncharacterised protein [Budvicia aquatica]